MQVIFDYQIFYLQRFGGISRYFIELAAELSKLKDCDPKIIAPYHGNDYLQEIKGQPYVKTFGPLQRRIYYNRLFDKRDKITKELLVKACSAKNTILHETYYTHRTPVNAPKVITIHDMIYEQFNNGLKDELEIIALKKKAIEEAELIIAVSENTRRDLVKFYPQTKSRTFVVHHGVRASKPVKSVVHAKPFLLHVGNRSWYKNFSTLLEIYCSDKNLHDSFDLVSFGGKKPSDDELKTIQKYKLSNKVLFLDGDDNLLNGFYQQAAALVYISGYEGFGMPVLEAMSAGCPVLCSDSSSLPEVAGSAALLVNAKDEGQIQKGLSEILFDSNRIKYLKEEGKKRAKLFTWEKCASETFNLYQKLSS